MREESSIAAQDQGHSGADLNLRGMVAIVTGGARGIGAGIAEVLASAGAIVAVTDIDQEAADSSARSLVDRGYQAVALRHDVTDPDSSLAVAHEVLEKYHRIDVLINNAGTSNLTSVVDMSVAQWDRMIASCLTSVFLVTRAVLPHMIEQRRGAIVNISSIAGKTGGALGAHYCSAKFGVIGFTQAVAREVAEHNVRVNAVCPGIIRTRLWEAEIDQVARRDGIYREEVWRNAVGDIPLQRPQSPRDVGLMIAFLVSPSAENITGQSINVDGGMVMH